MISYRKLAMRVLGHPLRVPTNTPRPASHRVTALALTAAMVAGMAAPAYAGTYYIGDGDITITKDEHGDIKAGPREARRERRNAVLPQRCLHEEHLSRRQRDPPPRRLGHHQKAYLHREGRAPAPLHGRTLCRH